MFNDWNLVICKLLIPFAIQSKSNRQFILSVT